MGGMAPLPGGVPHTNHYGGYDTPLESGHSYGWFAHPPHRWLPHAPPQRYLTPTNSGAHSIRVSDPSPLGGYPAPPPLGSLATPLRHPLLEGISNPQFFWGPTAEGRAFTMGTLGNLGIRGALHVMCEDRGNGYVKIGKIGKIFRHNGQSGQDGYHQRVAYARAHTHA